jgi:GAF domain-containing protein
MIPGGSPPGTTALPRLLARAIIAPMSSPRDELVAEVVVALTDTLSDGFDVADLLYTLTTACVELLDVDAAGVLLVDEQGRLVPVAATHGGSENLENLQILVKEGPCLDAVRASGTVRSTDLDDDVDRWPAFARQARAEGFRAAHAEPVALHAEVVGGLNLFRRVPGPLSDTDQRIAHFLGTAAAIGILHRRAQTNVETVNQQLEHALTSRVVIEQAKGFLAARHALDLDTAFIRLRGHARSRQRPLTEVARAVLDRSLDLG